MTKLCALLLAGSAALHALVASAAPERTPLIRFSTSPQIELRCVNGSGGISVPIPDRWDVKRVVLGLRYTVSSTLIAENSQLAIKVNDQPVAQAKLNPMAPNVEMEVEIPIGLLKSGYNNITFHVAQHYSRHNSGCENLCAPDLWTHINLLDSFLDVDYVKRPLPLKLGLVANWLFDPRIFPDAQVNLVVEKPDASNATLASIAASGIARRFDYRKVGFKLSQKLMPGMDNVLVGSEAFARRILEGAGHKLGAVDSGLLRIYHAVDATGAPDVTHALIVATGNTPQAVRVAAGTLANLSLPYPGGPELRTTGYKLPDLPMYGGRQVLSTDKKYDFKTLGFPTNSWLGFNPTPLGLNFRLPADFLIKQNQFAKVAINFSYSAGLRGDSVFNVLVNGKPLRSIYLDQVAGAYIENYSIDIPTYVFKPGANTITFSPVLNVPRQICDSSQVDGTFLTLYENSTVIFPPMPHMVELPKLELFALNGFPFTRWPDGYETMIYVPGAEPAALEAALNLVGVITQRNGFPLFNTVIVEQEPTDFGGELMVIGRIGVVPPKLLEGAPLRAGQQGIIPYPVSRGWDQEASVIFSNQTSTLGKGRGMIMQYESPFKRGRSIILLLAETGEDLGRLGEALLDSSVQAVAGGDLMLIEYVKPERHKVTVMNVGPRYVSGKSGDVGFLDAFFFANRTLFYALFVGLLVLLAVGFAVLVRRRYKSRQPKD